MASRDPAKILLVDDQPENLLALEAVLEELGERLVCVSSGVEALKRLLEEDYAVVILDVQMPEMDGFETARLIRARERTRNTPIIFLTAINTTQEHIFRAYSLGAFDYLFKPFVPEVLKAKVSAFVALYRQARQLQEEIEQRKQAEDAVRRLNRDLERRVRARTAELRAINEALEAEIAERQRVVDELAAAARHKDQFLSMLAHELRNPIGALSNALRLLEAAPAGSPSHTRALQIARRQVLHQTRMVDDLLDVSRITRGKIQLHCEPLDLAEVADNVVEDYRANVQHAGLELTLERRDPAPAAVVADRTRIVQILCNLLDNAIKFTPAGGAIEVRVGRDTSGARAEMIVADSGIGIAPEVLPHVFEPFRQADSSLDRSRGGLGLGLALVSGLAAMHDGEVEVRSPGPGKGAEFIVRLPLAEAGRPKDEGPASLPQSAPAPRSQRVLVVEDNRDAAETLKDLLELAGCDVELAFTGPEGVEAARRFHPEVVLCDIGLPGMDGYGVAAALRGQPETAGSRLVAVTGYGQEEDRLRALDAGFDLHLVKPVDPDELQAALFMNGVGKTSSRKRTRTRAPGQEVS